MKWKVGNIWGLLGVTVLVCGMPNPISICQVRDLVGPNIVKCHGRLANSTLQLRDRNSGAATP